jgi:hypothetical protein
MKTIRANPMMPPAAAPEPAPVRTVRPAPQPRADSGTPGMVKTGRGMVPQKPHNPANQLAAMPTSQAVAGYKNGGMVKGKC